MQTGKGRPVLCGLHPVHLRRREERPRNLRTGGETKPPLTRNLLSLGGIKGERSRCWQHGLAAAAAAHNAWPRPAPARGRLKGRAARVTRPQGNAARIRGASWSELWRLQGYGIARPPLAPGR